MRRSEITIKNVNWKDVPQNTSQTSFCHAEPDPISNLIISLRLKSKDPHCEALSKTKNKSDVYHEPCRPLPASHPTHCPLPVPHIIHRPLPASQPIHHSYSKPCVGMQWELGITSQAQNWLRKQGTTASSKGTALVTC